MLPEPDNRLKEYDRKHSNPLLNRPSNPSLDVAITKGGNKRYDMQKFRSVTLTIINTISLVGTLYYFIPGFNHIFTQGTSWQPTLGFLCLIIFLIAVQFTPNKKESK
jgi:hypothetical protein